MAITLLQSAKKIVTGVNNTTLAYGSNLTAGNLLVVSHTHWVEADNTITTPTDTRGHTYVAVGAEQFLDLGGDGIRLNSFYEENCSAGADTVTFDINGSLTGDITCVVSEFSGIVTTGALDKTAAGAGTSTAVASSATATTAQADELIWGAMTFSGATATIDETVGGTSGFQIVQEDQNSDTNMVIACEYKVVAAAAAYQSLWTLGASRQFICHVATFQAAGGGGGSELLPKMMHYYGGPS